MLHPFYSASSFRASAGITDNILAWRRRPLTQLGIRDPRHQELVDRFTARKPADRWTVSDAAVRSSVFAAAGGGSTATDDAASDLMDAIALRLHQPQGSCEEQMLAPELVRICPHLPDVMGNIDRAVTKLVTGKTAVATQLDEDGCVRFLVHLRRTFCWRLLALSRSVT